MTERANNVEVDDFEFPRCASLGCANRSSSNPFRVQGKVVCQGCAAAAAGGRCVDCKDVFGLGLHFSNLLCYAGTDGRALCISCWANDGLRL